MRIHRFLAETSKECVTRRHQSISTFSVEIQGKLTHSTSESRSLHLFHAPPGLHPPQQVQRRALEEVVELHAHVLHGPLHGKAGPIEDALLTLRKKAPRALFRRQLVHKTAMARPFRPRNRLRQATKGTRKPSLRITGMPGTKEISHHQFCRSRSPHRRLRRGGSSTNLANVGPKTSCSSWFSYDFHSFRPISYANLLSTPTRCKPRGAHGHQAEMARAHALEVVVRKAAHADVLQAVKDAHDVAAHVVLFVELVEPRVPTYYAPSHGLPPPVNLW